MKYPIADQTSKAFARQETPNFGLTARALEFARLYAENPRIGATWCALKAGYSGRCKRGGHVRGWELLRDPRVLRAILHYGANALNKAMAEARQHLAYLAIKEGRIWSGWDRNAFNRLTARLNGLESYAERLERIYAKEVYTREHIYEQSAIDVGSEM